MAIWVAFFFSALTYLHNDIYIDFADEGFLWYGVLHVLKGMVPIRDFQSYDPGRYYWCAAIMSLCCKGLMSLRFAAGVFQFVALCSGLSVCKRINRSTWFLFISGLVLTVWMLIPWRYFDAGMALLALLFAVRLAEKPSVRRHLAAGLFTGLAAFFGINHGIYVFAGMFSLILYLDAKKSVSDAARKKLLYAAGLLIGLLPFFFMFIFIEGFAQSYIQQLAGTSWAMSSGRMMTSNPVTWPWMVSWDKVNPLLSASSGRTLEFINILSGSCLYLFTVVYYLVMIPAIFKSGKVESRIKAVWVASFFIGLFYLRHAFSHSNICYLGEGILPVWIGLTSLAVLSHQLWLKRLLLAVSVFFVVASLCAAGLIHAITFKTMVQKNAMIWYPVGQDKIWIPKTDALYIEDVKNLVSAYVKPEEPILLAPLLTTFYCLLEKESPAHELYFHIAPMPAMDLRTTRELEEKKVKWAIVANVLIDGRPEQSMPNSHPILWAYLMDKFEPVPTKGLMTGYFLMKRKE